MSTTAKTAAAARRAGFDQARVSDENPGYVRVGCSQCEALVINGVATHERGCPNTRSTRRPGFGSFHTEDEDGD